MVQDSHSSSAVGHLKEKWTSVDSDSRDSRDSYDSSDKSNSSKGFVKDQPLLEFMSTRQQLPAMIVT